MPAITKSPKKILPLFVASQGFPPIQNLQPLLGPKVPKFHLHLLLAHGQHPHWGRQPSGLDQFAAARNWRHVLHVHLHVSSNTGVYVCLCHAYNVLTCGSCYANTADQWLKCFVWWQTSPQAFGTLRHHLRFKRPWGSPQPLRGDNFGGNWPTVEEHQLAP